MLQNRSNLLRMGTPLLYVCISDDCMLCEALLRRMSPNDAAFRRALRWGVLLDTLSCRFSLLRRY